MGAYSYYRFIFLLSRIDRWKVYNRLVSACTVKTAIKVQCSCVSTNKNSTFVGLLRFLPSCRNLSANLAFRATVIEDTHLTLAAIPFNVEANNPLIFLPLQT